MKFLPNPSRTMFCYRHASDPRSYQAAFPRQQWTPFTTIQLQRQVGFTGSYMLEALFQEALYQRDYAVVDDLMLMAPDLRDVWHCLVQDIEDPEARTDLQYDMKVIEQMVQDGHLQVDSLWKLEQVA